MPRKSNGNKSLFLVIVPLLILAGIFLFFNKMVFSNLILARGDMFLYFYPYWQAAADALHAGRIPFWNQEIFMGAPFLANSQIGFFYPLNWPLWWLLPTPYAINASILLHIFFASLGTYLAARRALNLGRFGAIISALTFGLGGYLTAQVEHINQLQGLAWLPWFILVLGPSLKPGLKEWLKKSVFIGILFSLQLLGGHTQTTFITAVAIFIWLMVGQFTAPLLHSDQQPRLPLDWKARFTPILALAAGGGLAGLLAAIQLLPTLELTQYSARQGGLPANEVLSFSLNPIHWTRSFLPAHGQSLFTEYVAILPLIILALAFIGAWQWRRWRGTLPAIAWIVTSFLLASGIFNPLNWLLARLPLFNFFRVPSRWLVLYALGAAFLAGIGWQVLAGYIKGEYLAGMDRVSARKLILRPVIAFFLVALLLMVWGYAASAFVAFIPTGPEAPYESPTSKTVVFWVVELLFILVIVFLLTRKKASSWGLALIAMLTICSFALHFLATRSLPYNNLTTPEAYFDLRPPISRLLVETGDTGSRFLSLSDIFFDPGDQGEIDTIYQDQLPASAMYDYTIAIKQKEIIAPNLSMIYGLPAVDGFDGGVLPLRTYSELMRLLLPDGALTSDGRLRENLDAVPEGRWLDLFNAGYLITDKVGDIWLDGVFYDRQHPAPITAEYPVQVAYIPPFEATEVRFLATKPPDQVIVELADGRVLELSVADMGAGAHAAKLPEPALLNGLIFANCPPGLECVIEAVTLVDGRDGAFHALVPGDYRLIHSGDVKIYENLDVLPRAFMVFDWQWASTLTETLRLMESPEFDPSQTAVILSNGKEIPLALSGIHGIDSSPVEIEKDDPELVVLSTSQNEDGLLLLTDSYYQGWHANIDGEPLNIYQVNGNFRGVFVPAGEHLVTFKYQPTSYQVGMIITIIGLFLILGLVLMILWPRKAP